MARPTSLNGGRPRADRAEVVKWLKDRLSKGPVELAVIEQEYEKLVEQDLSKPPGLRIFTKEAFKAARKELRNDIVSRSGGLGIWWLTDMTVANKAIPAVGAPRTAMVEAARQIIKEDRARQEVLDDLTAIATAHNFEALSGSLDATPERCLQVMQDRLNEESADYGITREQLVEIEKQRGPSVILAERATKLAAKTQRLEAAKQQQETVERVQAHRQAMTEIAKEFAAEGATPNDCLQALKAYAAKQDVPPPDALIEATAYLHGPRGE